MSLYRRSGYRDYNYTPWWSVERVDRVGNKLEEYIVKGLKPFCTARSISYGGLFPTWGDTGRWRDWVCRRMSSNFNKHLNVIYKPARCVFDLREQKEQANALPKLIKRKSKFDKFWRGIDFEKI